jgi:hypothetical protein
MILDRGFIIIEPKSEFILWIENHSIDPIIGIDDSEPSIYLIEDDFLDDDLVIKQNYEEIFLYELEISGIEEKVWPDIDFENFKRFFTTTVGVSVVDLKQK